MESREQRIAALASTLRASGIAKSDSQAKMMAEDMVGVEEHVQKDYEVEHTRANEYLQTAKNLGAPRQTIKPESKVEKINPIGSRKIEPLVTSSNTTITPNNSKVTQEYTDINFGGKTLNQAFDHDTHNSALESIKAQISRMDVYEDTKTSDVNNVVEESAVDLTANISDLTPTSEPLTSARLDEIMVKTEPDKLIIAETEQEAVVDVPVEQDSIESESPKLDAQKLIDMMEEDGKLEEHTKEIKEKPKDVKPKEAYEENNIDLSNMFDFNKGTIRK